MADSEHPNTADLRTLLALADAGSETAAAKELGISQPVVNRRLQLFFKPPALLRRHRGRVTLTDKGREALPAVRRLLRQHDHLQQYLAGRREQGNLLAIGVGASAGQFYLARAIALLRQQLPDWEIQTRVQRGKERIAGVVEGTLDVAIVTHSSLQIENIARWACSSQTELQVDELAGLPLCVIARRETAEAQQLQAVLAAHAVPVEMLGEFPLAGLDRESGIRRQIEALLRARNQRLDFTVEAGGWLGVKEFVRQGLCAGLMPLALLWPDDMKQLVIRRLPPELSVAHRIVYRQDAEMEILDRVKAALGESASAFRQQTERRWQGML